eukprot:s2028_g2.t2
MVKFGSEEFATLDNYETELNWEEDEHEDDLWSGEDQLQFTEVPDSVWSSMPLDKAPPPPERWVDQIADEREIQRLLTMGVLEKASDEVEAETLTTRFVYDWRIKQHKSGKMMWMRRSRFVAREFASTRRHDTYSPATGSHTANLVPLVFLKMLSELVQSGCNDEKYKIILASLDIKDAFLQVPQEKVIEVSLYQQRYLIKRNLPGQRLGAKAWYWYFRSYVSANLNFSWCPEQPCLARCIEEEFNNVFMVHVDDLLFAGSQKFWTEKFLPKMQFSVSFNELKDVGSTISFLKRRLVRLEDGLMVVPGTTTDKVVACFEKHFGQAKIQKVPCDSTIQNEDSSPCLSPSDSSSYRSVIGLLLYLSRDRLDTMFVVKELASYMSAPTLVALQKLRKLVGYLKGTGDYGVKLTMPEHGVGRWKRGGEHYWLVECFTDADWSSNKQHRKSTSSAIHFVNANMAYASSRTQRVVSLSSAESELHAMVAGCSDAIFIKRCLQFLVNDQIDHYQWTDNSAARQLVSRQGVGRIRHLSGKILWIQTLVLEKEVEIGQIPTEWNYSDIGTKALAKKRLLMLLNQIGVMNPESLEPIGQEEFEEASERSLGKQSLKRVVKSVMRLAFVMGLEPGVFPAADAVEVSSEVCHAGSNASDEFWLWVVLGFMGLLWTGFAVTAFFMWKRLSTDLRNCWNQVADGDHYAGYLDERINEMGKLCERLDTQRDMLKDELMDEITRVSNEGSMDHDYCTGLHYAVVEAGGYVEHAPGLTNDQFIHMMTLERANLVTSRAMGSNQYMQLVRQRAVPRGHADETNVGHNEESEGDSNADDMEIDAGEGTAATAIPGTVTETTEFLKDEHLACVQRGELRDANVIRNLILEFLQVAANGFTEQSVSRCRVRISATFRGLTQTASDQNRWESATRYDGISEDFQT